MTSEQRRQLARIGAPAAFLLAVTVAVLLIRSATSDGETTVAQPTQTTPAATATTSRVETVRTVATTTAAATEPYVIESGDTLATIADEHETTVERLLELNPGIDPVALRVGQRILVPAG